jgi:hypothetical protein
MVVMGYLNFKRGLYLKKSTASVYHALRAYSTLRILIERGVLNRYYLFHRLDKRHGYIYIFLTT